MLTLLVGFDQLGNFRASAHRFDQYYVAFVQEHAVWTVPLIAAPHEHTGDRFGLLIDRTLNVIHVGQLGKFVSRMHELAVVKLPRVEQDGRVGRRDFRSLMPVTPFTTSETCQ